MRKIQKDPEGTGLVDRGRKVPIQVRLLDLPLSPRERDDSLGIEDLWIIENPLATLAQISTYKKGPGNPLALHVPQVQPRGQTRPLVKCGAEVCSELTWLQTTEGTVRWAQVRPLK